VSLIVAGDFIIHPIRGYISMIYLAVYADKILMLDGGSRSDAARVEKYCVNTLNRPVTDIRLCVASHAHPDHAGGAVELRKRHGIPVAAHPFIDRWYSGISGTLQHKVDCVMAHVVRAADRVSFQRIVSRRLVRPDIVLGDGGALPGFEDWQALHVPGHTLHDLALYNREAGVLYAGDCIINRNGKFNIPIPVFFHGAMRRSYGKLAALDARTIIPAHGNVVENADCREIFARMMDLLEKPRNEMSKMAHRVSVFAPPVWKAYVRKWRSRKEMREGE
jgi:glyoxylase-like metal-dependent hydrolase (beta-lactamase superfamily II)